jgi:hypothetical protein
MWALFLLASAQASDPVIRLSGTIQSVEPGPIRIELLLPQDPGQNPLLLWEGWVEGSGAYSILVPAGLDAVKLRAAADLKRDGIGPDDPQIRLPISLTIGQEDIHGIDLAIRPPEHRAPALPSPVSPPQNPPVEP